MLRIRTLKILDILFGELLVRALSVLAGKHEAIPSVIRKILVIRPGGIGDLILLIPAIKVLKKNLPGIDIDILCEKRNSGVSAFLKDEINAFYEYNRPLSLLKCVRTGYEAVIDTEQWHRLSAVTAFLTHAPVRIGFSTNIRKKLLSHPVDYDHNRYEVDNFLRLLEPLGINVILFSPHAPFISTGKGSDEFRVFKNGRKIVCIAPGATVKERIWPADNYAETAARLTDNGYGVVILGSGNNRKISSKIKKAVPGCLDLTGRTDLASTAAVLADSAALVSPDSGIMHLAYAAGTPTVSLFGAGIEEKWAPRGKKNITINKHLECSPCTRFGYTKNCRKGVACMAVITPDDVMDALKHILSV